MVRRGGGGSSGAPTAGAGRGRARAAGANCGRRTVGDGGLGARHRVGLLGPGAVHAGATVDAGHA
eukprot:981556-Pleurochrysis_carterae.AAC.1